MTPSNPRSRNGSDPSNSKELFQSLSDGEARTGAVTASIGVHAVLLSLLLIIPLLMPQAIKLSYGVVTLAPPPPPIKHIEPLVMTLPKPVAVPKPLALAPAPVVEKLITPAPPAPKPAPSEPARLASVPKPSAPAPMPVTPVMLDPKAPPAIAMPKPPVVTNVFSTPTNNPQIVVPRNVEGAGFGETTSVVARPGKAESVSVAGFGDSNGSRETGRPSRGAGLGTVEGFGGVVGGTGTGPGTGGSRGSVTVNGFGTVAASKPDPAPQKVAEVTNEKPVEVLSKPRPDYTDEARKLRIEGEVLLRVLFTGTGEAHVLEVINGLGHGLNENAVRAAEQIRFKPALRAGQAVDSRAVVHIVFQLAY